MALKVYKPGEGYWTRLMSAIGAGTLVLAGVMELWNQLENIDWAYRIYLQGGLALLLISVFGLLIFKWVYSAPRTSDFMIATEGEMKKVNWPTSRQVFGSTWVVISCLVLMLVVLFLSDFVFLNLFRLIGIQPTT